MTDAPAWPRERLLLGAGLLAAGMPALLGLLVAFRDDLAYATCVLLVLALVVLVASVGGVRTGLPAALAGTLALDWFLTPPFGTLHVADPEQLVVLVAFVAVATGVSAAVGRAGRLGADAVRARAEARTVAALAGQALAEQATLPGVLEQVRRGFGMREVSLLEPDGAGGWTVAGTASADASAGAAATGEDETQVDVTTRGGARLVARGRPLFAEDRRVLTQLADVAATALEGRRLAQLAAGAEAADSTRRALLAAVGHDLRTPLAGIAAAVTSLQATDVRWSPEQTAEFLGQVKDSADRLQRLVDDLLDASRLDAGALVARPVRCGVAELVDRALLSLGWPERVHPELPADLPDVCTDEGLTVRVLANVLENALRYSPVGMLVTVRAASRPGAVLCEVVDHGPGLPAQAWAAATTPFERRGERRGGGVGLGLAVAAGFAAATGVLLEPSPTPGGGLTMRVRLPVAGTP